MSPSSRCCSCYRCRRHRTRNREDQPLPQPRGMIRHDSSSSIERGCSARPIWRSVHPSDGGGDMARLFSIRPAITLRGRKFVGIRGWNGKPTHPPLTDFPIVCYVLAALFDVLSWLGWVGSGGRFSPRDLFAAAPLALGGGFAGPLPTGTHGCLEWWRGLPRDRR